MLLGMNSYSLCPYLGLKGKDTRCRTACGCVVAANGRARLPMTSLFPGNLVEPLVARIGAWHRPRHNCKPFRSVCTYPKCFRLEYHFMGMCTWHLFGTYWTRFLQQKRVKLRLHWGVINMRVCTDVVYFTRRVKKKKQRVFLKSDMHFFLRRFRA